MINRALRKHWGSGIQRCCRNKMLLPLRHTNALQKGIKQGRDASVRIVIWIQSTCKKMYYIQTSSSQRSRKTEGEGNSSALTCRKNSLDAEPVSCTENFLFLKKNNATYTLPGSNCFVPYPVVTNSSIVVSSSRHRASTTIVPATTPRHLHSSGCSHFWFWHITTLILVLASASKILWSVCLSISQDSMSDCVEQHQGAVVNMSSNVRQVIQCIHSHLRPFL